MSCTMYMQYLQRPEEGIRSPGSRVRVASCHGGAGNEPRSSARATSIHNYWAISPAPSHFSFYKLPFSGVRILLKPEVCPHTYFLSPAIRPSAICLCFSNSFFWFSYTQEFQLSYLYLWVLRSETCAIMPNFALKKKKSHTTVRTSHETNGF